MPGGMKTGKRSTVVLFLIAAGGMIIDGCGGARHVPPQATVISYDPAAIPAGPEGAQIRLGRAIFNKTPRFAAPYTGAKLSCGDCHINSGTQPYAAPMVNLAGLFPMYNERAGRVISLKDRIQECFARSENGRPLPPHSPEMRSLVAYINWLSRTEIKGKVYQGRGFAKQSLLKGDAVAGKQKYASQCANCHGIDGAGVPPILPPVWGPNSYNDEAGMNRPEKMAAFLVRNMPQNHPGSLTSQDAFDISAFLHTMPRPTFNQAYKGY
jgi:thiosulfate dehydrogenase